MSHEKSHEKFKYESRMASEDVAGYLESLAAGIRQREVLLESGNDSVSLRVADELSFECSAKEDPEKARASFTVSAEWRTESHEGAGTSPGLHVITGSMLDAEPIVATDSADRAVLIARPVTDAVHDSGPSTAPAKADKAGKKPSAHRSAPRLKASEPSHAKKASAGSRSHARRRAAS